MWRRTYNDGFIGVVTTMNDLGEKHPDVVFVYPIQIALLGPYVGKEAQATSE